MNVFRRFVTSNSTRICISQINCSRDLTNGYVAVSIDERTRTAKMTLQRPPVNSLNLELLREMKLAINDFEQKRLKGFIISSASPTVFSSGLDLMELYRPNEQRFREFWRALQEMWKTLYVTPLVTIATVNGHAPAGGCMIATSCDYRIMIEGPGTIGMNETKLGICAPKWFQDLLVRTIGFRNAEKGLYLGTLFTPKEALELNIVDELVSTNGELEDKASSRLAEWTKIPAAARQLTKTVLRQSAVDDLVGYQDEEIENVWKHVSSENMQVPLQRYMDTLKAKKS